MSNDEDKKEFNYFEDYKLKVDYLKVHFDRMWTRFNYFLGLQSALFGVSILAPAKFNWGVPVFGIGLSFIWYFVGVQDRYLIDLYREQIKQAWSKVSPKPYKALQGTVFDDYCYIGQTDKLPFINRGEKSGIDSDKNRKIIRKITDFFKRKIPEKNGLIKEVYPWRWKFSTTRLAYLFSVFTLLLWIGIGTYYYIQAGQEEKERIPCDVKAVCKKNEPCNFEITCKK